MMPPKASGNAPADDLDDLFNYDVNPEDVFRPFDTSLDVPSAPQKDEPHKADLGIDEEIKPIRKRKPAPKLDEDR